MPVNQEAGTSRVFVVINARSGNASPDLVRKMLESQGAEGAVDLSNPHEPREGEDISAHVPQAVANGFETVVCSRAETGRSRPSPTPWVGTPSRLGIIPLGTTNVLVWSSIHLAEHFYVGNVLTKGLDQAEELLFEKEHVRTGIV